MEAAGYRFMFGSDPDQGRRLDSVADGTGATATPMPPHPTRAREAYLVATFVGSAP